MADSSLLAQIIAGQDPLAAQMLGGYQGAQLSNAALDPSFAHNEGPFGALAKTIAGFSGGNQLRDAVNATVQARMAAQPDIARLYASTNPYKDIDANPGAFSPLARAMVLNSSPLQAAQTREALANAELAGLNVSGFRNAQNPTGAAGMPSGISAPAAKQIAPPTVGPPINGRYPNQTETALPQGAGGSQPISDPVAAAAGMTPQQRQQMLADPKQKAMILQRLRALAAQKQAATQSVPNSGDALRPPT